MVDVTIKGAGIFGLSIAWACVARGAKVTIVDPAGVGGGASGGVVGALAPHVPENWNAKKAFQLDSLLMAQGFWRDVQEAGGQDPGYARTGRLQPIPSEKARVLAERRAETARGLWKSDATWKLIRSDPSDPWHPPSPTGWLIHDTLSAHIHPRRAVHALAAALAAKGAEVVPDAAERGAVIWATGADGLRALSEELSRPIGNAVKGQAAVLGYDAVPNAPQLFVDSLHVVPHKHGGIAIGSTSERDYDDPTTTDGALDDIIKRVRAALPVLANAPVQERWAGLRPRAQSRAPILGPHPKRAGQFIANGGFKIGFGMAPKIADVMADLVLASHDRIPNDFRLQPQV